MYIFLLIWLKFANRSTQIYSEVDSHIFLPVVLYGCETWSHNWRVGRRLRVFENRVLRSVFGPKRDEVTWDWRKLHNEGLNDVYSSPNIILVIKSPRISWERHVTLMGDRRGAYRVLVGKETTWKIQA